MKKDYRGFTKDEMDKTGKVLKLLMTEFKGPSSALPTLSMAIAYIISDFDEAEHENVLEITDYNTRQALKCVVDASPCDDNVVPFTAKAH